MVRNRGRRERQLRAIRERRARSQQPPSDPADVAMRFECGTCGTGFQQPGVIVSDFEVMLHDEDGNVVRSETVEMGQWTAPCPVCHQPVVATNQVRTVVDGHGVIGFADTPQQLAQLRQVAGELRKLQADASLDDIVKVVERQGPALAPLAQYLRDNHLAISAHVQTGLSLLAVVIALIALHLQMRADDAPLPPPPPGVSPEQISELVDELRKDERVRPQQQRDDRQGQGGKGQSDKRGGRPGGDDPDERG